MQARTASNPVHSACHEPGPLTGVVADTVEDYTRRERFQMSPKVAMATDKTPAEKSPTEINAELRTLAHDLSNAIETIMQATYLLGTAQIDDNGRKWLELIDKASRDAARINREIREILRSQSEPS